MPQPLTGYITKWRADYSTLAGLLWSAGAGLKNAADAIRIQQWQTAHDHLDGAGQNILNASQVFRYGTDPLYDVAYNALHWIDLNIGGGGVDMDSILTAMITAKFSELEKFIGIVDAYRVALWNAPFNADFYGALARGFQQWPQG